MTRRGTRILGYDSDRAHRRRWDSLCPEADNLCFTGERNEALAATGPFDLVVCRHPASPRRSGFIRWWFRASQSGVTNSGSTVGPGLAEPGVAPFEPVAAGRAGIVRPSLRWGAGPAASPPFSAPTMTIETVEWEDSGPLQASPPRPSQRYTEAALVRALEDLGIGRPSTHAASVSVLQERE